MRRRSCTGQVSHGRLVGMETGLSLADQSYWPMHTSSWVLLWTTNRSGESYWPMLTSSWVLPWPSNRSGQSYWPMLTSSWVLPWPSNRSGQSYWPMLTSLWVLPFLLPNRSFWVILMRIDIDRVRSRSDKPMFGASSWIWVCCCLTRYVPGPVAARHAPRLRRADVGAVRHGVALPAETRPPALVQLPAQRQRRTGVDHRRRRRRRRHRRRRRRSSGRR